MAVGDVHVFPDFLTLVLTRLFFPKPPTAFLTCFCTCERRKYTRKKARLNWGSNSQPPGHESDTLTTEPPVWGIKFVVCKNFQIDLINLKLYRMIQLKGKLKKNDFYPQPLPILVVNKEVFGPTVKENRSTVYCGVVTLCKYLFENTMWDKEKMLVTSLFFSFLTMFSTLSMK